MKRAIFFHDVNEDESVVKQKNYFLKKRLIKLIFERKQLSISSIKNELNISVPSVHKLVEELINEKVLKDMGVGESIGGRRPNMYGLNPTSFYILAIEINRVSIRMGLMNPLNEFISLPEEFFVDLENTEEYGEQLFEMVKRFVIRSGVESYKVLAAGVSVPGLVDSRKGKSYSYLSYSEEGLAKWLQGYIGIPVYIENDSRIMTLAEYKNGGVQGVDNALCVNFTEGIGLGMIFNGALYEGNSGLAGEFGHLQIKEQGDVCYCGRKGCLETLASGNALLKNAKEEWDNGGFTILRDVISNKNAITISAIIEAAKSGDKKSVDLLSDIGENLGKGIVILLHLLNPEKIIIGGSISMAGKYIVDPVRQAINKYAISRIADDTEITTSSIKDNVFLYGAFFLAMKNIFQDIDNTIV